jgi:hypothetical protein
MVIAAFIAGGILGGFAVWLVLRERVGAHRQAAEQVSGSFAALSAEALRRTHSTVSVSAPTAT